MTDEQGVAHKIVCMIGTIWDEAGRRPPRNWIVRCSCGKSAHSLPGQLDAMDWWDEHLRAALGARS